MRLVTSINHLTLICVWFSSACVDPAKGSEEGDIESAKPSVSKCCDLYQGFTFENKSMCMAGEDEFLPEFEDRPEYSELARGMPVETRYEYFIGDPCTDGKYILDLEAYSYDRYSIFSNGTLLYLDEIYSRDEYCLETVNGTLRAFICFGVRKGSYEPDITFIIYAVGLIISIPFLVATAVVYLGLDLFRDLKGKSLASHVLSLATGYACLVIVQLASDQLNEDLCAAAGFIIQFFFVTAFFWLNVICYDTWHCIKNEFRCAYTPRNIRSEKIKFCRYSLYAWGGPVILSIVSLVMDLDPAIPESFLKPNFGLQSCWFYSDDAALPYFYAPVGIVIFINLIFFSLSAIKIYKEQKKLSERLKNTNSADKTRDKVLSIRIYTRTLKECVFLFGIMGVNWAAEVISWAVGGSQTIWLVTDIFNTLQGVLIFYLFVIKQRKVRNEVKSKIGRIWKKIIKCDCEPEEREGKKCQSRHWHPGFEDEMEMNPMGENASFLPQPEAV